MMALKVYKCEGCRSEFTMDDKSVDDEEGAYCPSCGEEDSVVQTGEDEER